MISPIGFTGIRNIGYTKFYTTDENVNIHSRYALNMQLTDDDKGNDLTEYKKLLKENPDLKNKINSEYLNIEFDTARYNEFLMIKTKMNGNTIPRSFEKNKIISFMDKIVHKVASFKTKDFDTDECHHLDDESLKGLIYNENMDDYVDSTKGSLDLLCQEYIDDNPDGTAEPVVIKLRRYLSDGNIKLKENSRKKIYDAVDYILETMYNPMYVHNGAVIMDAMAKGMNISKTDN